ncbi:LppM family (lipo)protein [Arthrobacter cavernae]|uniref:LppM domain-containing protein n=1 Tax=Arthrobacter cavernae TaxID=2817681 RepID=A0A939KNC0_9MICC|nr:hypothetical protein [Arthrobacter cavernae]MBO1267465.1 hypothetical protein [Arthrobacter cavernae]
MIAAVLALSGCFKINMDIKVNSEKSVDYDVVYAIQKAVLGDKSFDEFMQSNGSSSEEMGVPEGATVVDYEDDEYKGKRITAKGLEPAKISAASDADSPFELRRDGDFYILTMGGVTGADSSDPATAGMAKSIFDEATVKISFPGTVVEAQGAKIDGNTATFDMLAMTEGTVQVKAESNAGFAFPMWLLWVLIVVLEVAAALILLFVLLRRKQAAQPAAALAGAGMQPGYPQSGHDVQPPAPDAGHGGQVPPVPPMPDRPPA